jgi:predicted signal transduction protein with EAL and GGDEF domain
MVTPAARREAVALLREKLEVSERRACTMIGICRMMVRYRSQRPDDGRLRERLKALADERRRFGGIRLAIDDFGVGYSSLDYLRRFPVDRIKVAQAFVDSIATEPGSAAIVRATIGLARELGIDLVAEGVETNDQLESLKAWGCRDAQGFYFAEPLTAEFLTPLLARGRVSGLRPAFGKTAA